MEQEQVDSHFATTAWTMLRGSEGDSTRSQGQLDRLCRIYWYPVYAFIRKRTERVEDAQDLCQIFFTEYIVDRRIHRKARSEAGKFRTFLLACVKNFLVAEHRIRIAQKRGGGMTRVSFEELEHVYMTERSEGRDPAEVFDRAWARTVFDSVWSEIEKSYLAKEKGAQFEVLKEHMMGGGEGLLREKALELGLTEGGLKKAAFDLRARFRVTLREAVAKVVEHPEEIDAEISHLIQVIR